MTALLVAAAVIAGAGAIAALAPIDPRLGLIGLTACLVGAALIADPLPDPAVLAVRLTGALLTVVVLRAASHPVVGSPRDRSRGWSGQVAISEVGWPAGLLFGAAGAVAGLAIAAAIGSAAAGSGDVGQPAIVAPADLLGAESLALGLAGLVGAVAVGPLLADATSLRRSVAAVLLTDAVLLARHGLVMTSSALDEVVFTALLVTVAIASSAVVNAAAATRPGATAPADALAAVGGSGGSGGPHGPSAAEPSRHGVDQRERGAARRP